MSVNIALLAPTVAAFVAGGSLWVFAYRIKHRRASLSLSSAAAPAMVQPTVAGNFVVPLTMPMPSSETLFDRPSRFHHEAEEAAGKAVKKARETSPQEKTDKARS